MPTILLGLGALCLLVAAVTFLAFAWTWMGVGGRTAVLAGLTAAAGGAGIWLGGRGLRVAAESLTTVSLGLVALDVAGAVTAGWFGPRSDESLVLLAGAGVAAVGWAMVAAPARLVAPQLGVCLGLLVAFLAGIGISGHDRLLGVAAIAAFAASAWAARLLGARVLMVAAAFGATGWWVWLAGRGLVDAIAEPTVRSLWVDGNGYALAAGAGIVLLAGILVPGRPSALRGATAVSTAILSFLVVLPALDEGGTCGRPRRSGRVGRVVRRSAGPADQLGRRPGGQHRPGRRARAGRVRLAGGRGTHPDRRARRTLHPRG